MNLTIGQLIACFPAIAPNILAQQIDALGACAVAAQLATPERWAMFLAQCSVESAGFSHFEENLNYSAAGLLSVFPHHFDSRLAALYARQPERIANRAYAGRLGNGDESSGDGWKYRGRGAIQVTGFANYSPCGTFLGIDLRSNPDLAAGDARFLTAAWYWSVHNLNRFADAHDCPGATRTINGPAMLGLSQRQTAFDRCLSTLASPLAVA